MPFIVFLIMNNLIKAMRIFILKRSKQGLLVLLFLLFGVLSAEAQDYSGFFYIANNNDKSPNYNIATPETNYYLVPASNGGNASIADAAWAYGNPADTNKPLLTTFQTNKDSNTTNQIVNNSVWQIIKKEGESYYFIKHCITEKYVVYNTPLEYNYRRAFHLEDTDDPCSLGDAALFKIELVNNTYFNISSKNRIVANNGYCYLNPSKGCQNSYYGLSNNGQTYVDGLIGVFNVADNAGSKWYLEVPSPIISFDNVTQKVSITSTLDALHPNYDYYYTTDGTAPTISADLKYNGPFVPNSGGTIKAIAVSTGGSVSSQVATFSLEQVATPDIQKDETNNCITITCATEGATIYYTINGTTPTTASSVYSEPLGLSYSGKTITAVAVKTNMLNSASTSQTITLKCPVPEIYPDYETSLVHLFCDAGNATIYYSFDNFTSTIQYTGPFSLSGTATVKAYATLPNCDNSDIVTYDITKAATPVVQLDAATNNITITTNTIGADIYYTIDGSDPTPESLRYTGPFREGPEHANVSEVLIKAIAVKPGLFCSNIGSGSETLTCEPPLITRTGANTFEISSTFPVNGARIYYTTDGTDPTSSSTPYSGTITHGVPCTIKAIVVATSYNDSPIAERNFTSDLVQEDGIYLIQNDYDYTLFVAKANTPAGASSHYKLVANISAAGTSMVTTTFTGLFEGSADAEGNFYTISGLDHPMFREINPGITDGTISTNQGIVRNVILKDVNISNHEGNTGAIACEIRGGACIYNCGILSGSVGGTRNVGGIVGLLQHTVATGSPKPYNFTRVINCYSYANITSKGTDGNAYWAAGVVGNNSYESKVENYPYNNNDCKLKTAVVNCMFYGDITTTCGVNIAPVYGNEFMSSASGGDYEKTINRYDYFLDGSKFAKTFTTNIQQYRASWPADEKYLTRYEYYRSILNSNRLLCTYYVTGKSGENVYQDTALIAKWVRDESIAPYPILKKWGKYPSIINPDTERVWNTQSERWVDRANALDYQGKSFGTLSVAVKSGDHRYAATVPEQTTIQLTITAMDTLHWDYGYYKVQLPYYNTLFGNVNSTEHNIRYGGNYTDWVVTGWKITMVNGQTSGATTFVADWENGYNFADRTDKFRDLYNVSGRVYAQGGFYYVPEGVTSIEIEAYWGKAYYLRNKDQSIDRVSVTKPKNNTTDYEFTPAGHLLSSFQELTVYDSLQTAIRNLEDISACPTVYDQAIVLVGNLQVMNKSKKLGSNLDGKLHPFTIMSADFDMDNEPDYCFQFQFRGDLKRWPIQPIRFDFLAVPELGMAIRHDDKAYAIGVFVPQGHFEITETAFMHTTQFEYDGFNVPNYDGSDIVKIVSPVILNGGQFDQIVIRYSYRYNNTNNNGYADHTSYFIMGGHFRMKRFTPGAHTNRGEKTKVRLCAVNCIGGEYPEFYLSGIYRPDIQPQNFPEFDQGDPHCYINGGKFGMVAGAGYDKILGDVTFKIDNSIIDEFYGGGINSTCPVGGNIDVTINNSIVGKFCGGPKVGNMTSGKTVTTRATGTTFGQFYGGGNGGTNYYRDQVVDGNNWPLPSEVWDDWEQLHTTSTSQGVTTDNPTIVYNPNDPDVGFNPLNTRPGKTPQYNATKGYHGVFEFEVFNASNGLAGDNPTIRTYVHWVQFGTTRTGDVSSTLTDCTVLQDFYGGGNLGFVDGDVVSTLQGNTIIYGSAYGGGYSAAIPTFRCYDMSRPIFPTRDLSGVMHHGELETDSIPYVRDANNEDIYYQWINEIPDDWTMPDGFALSTDNPVFEYPEGSGKWYCYTDKSLENLGVVSGNTTLNVNGNTKIYGKKKSEVNPELVEFAGAAFGGGDESAVLGNTTVTVSGTSGLLVSNVYGGGNIAVTGGDSKVIMEQGIVGVMDQHGVPYPNSGRIFAAGKGSPDGKDLGWVKGNATLEMSGGTVLTGLYGGGEISNVGLTTTRSVGDYTISVPAKDADDNETGIATVNLSGGTVGYPRTLEEIYADHNSCHVFGSGKGDPAAAYNTWTNVNKTVVNVTGGRVYGSVFGGGDQGHVLGDINVDIKLGVSDTLGTFGYSEVDGNVFGGGHGDNPSALTCGGTQGNINVHVRGAGLILGTVFGGGRIASTGIMLCNNGEGAGEPIPDTETESFGHVEILIEGDVKIGHDYVAVAEDGEEYLVGDVGGNVYGGAMGLDMAPTSIVGQMSHVKNTKVTVKGNAWVKGTVNGGGESGDVWKDTEVTIEGNCIIGLDRVKDGHLSLDKLVYSGNVFGGSWGCDSLKWVNMGRVYGNTTVHVKNGQIRGSVYGGGEYACVGTWDTIKDGTGAVTSIKPHEGTGLSTVIVEGGEIGPLDASGHNAWVFGAGMGVEEEMGSETNAVGINYNEFGQVFSSNVEISGGYVHGCVFGGGCMGSVGKAIDPLLGFDDFGHTTVSISGGTIGDPENSSSVVGNVYGGGMGDINREEYALAFHTDVTISNTAYVTGSVFGGSRDAQIGYGEDTGSTNVLVSGGNVGTEGNTAPYKGYVYGGGRGYHIDPNNPDEGKALGRVNGSTRVTVTGGDIWQFVFGGGNQSLVRGRKRVNIVDGWVHRDVYGGSNAIPSDEGWLQLHTGLKTVNIYGGKLNNVYGCSRSTLDGALDYSTSPPQPKDDVTSFVNISGGEIYGSVHGAGQSGRVNGSVMVYIGENAIYNAPYNMEGEDPKNIDRDDYNEVIGNVGRTHHPNKLHISGSVYGGADYFESQYHPGSWNDFNVTGYSNIYVDGKHYNMDADTTGKTYMLISGNIYGSGYQCESGQKGRTVMVRNYGDRVNRKDLPADDPLHAEVGDTEADWFAHSTRFMSTIQRCDNLVIDSSNFSFTGARILGSNSPERYSVAKIDSCMYVANASGISLGYGDGSADMDSIRMICSGALKKGTTFYDQRFPSKFYIPNDSINNQWFWIGVRDKEKYANNMYYVNADAKVVVNIEGETVVNSPGIGYACENVLVFNNDSRLYVRYQKKDKEGSHLVWKGNHYGELNGFFRMIATNFLPWGNESFAYARPKLTYSNGGSTAPAPEKNKGDGGFLSYERRYNFYIQDNDGDDGGLPHTQTYQYPYTNVMQLGQRDTQIDMEEFREWVTADFKGRRWYVDGTRGWGRDLMGSGEQSGDKWTYDWGLYPDKPKASISGTQGVFAGTNHWNTSTSSSEHIDFHYKDNIVYYENDVWDQGHTQILHHAGDVNESASTFKDAIYVVGPINGVLEDVSGLLNSYANEEGATLMLCRYPGGHQLSIIVDDATDSQFHEADGGSHPIATTYPRQTDPDYHGLSSGDAGPGANYGAMIVVGKNKNLTLDNIVVDGLFGHVGIDVTYMFIPDSYQQRKVMRPLVVTNTGSKLTMKGELQLKRGGNNIEAAYYNNESFNMGVTASAADTIPHGGALFVHPSATVNVEGLVRVCRNIQQLSKEWVASPEPGHYEYIDIESNVFLPTFDTYLHIKDVLSENTCVGVTNPAGNNESSKYPIDYQYNTFSPVAVASKSGATHEQNKAIANTTWKNDNFYDDLNWFFCNGENFENGSFNSHNTYYNSSIQDYPNGTTGHEYPMGLKPDTTLFFGWTWANVVRNKPAGYVRSTTEKKVTVSTPQGLAWLISRVNRLNGQTVAFSDTIVLQSGDLDLEQYVWVPIGTGRNANGRFEGSFDGQGHLIKHMNIHYIGIGDQRYEMNNYGLFGTILGAHINRTFVVDGYIHPANMANMGGLVGWAEAVKVGGVTTVPLIENSEAAVEMQLKYPVQSNAVGGLVGHFLIGNIRNSMAMPVIIGELGYVGGLVGYAGDLENVSLLTGDRKLENCFANITYDVRKYNSSGTVIPNDQIGVGGLIGHNRAFTMQNCYVTWTGAANQKGLTNGNFGTLVHTTEGSISKCYDFVNDYTNQSYLYDDCDSYTAVITSDKLGYLYSDNYIDGDTTLVARLTMNAWDLNPNDADTVYAHWSRPTLAEVNNDLPVLLLGEFDDVVDYQGKFRSVGTYNGGPALQYGGPVRDENQLDGALERLTATTDALFVYGDITTTLTATPYKDARISIFEDASIVTPGTLSNHGYTYVGVSFDNSSRNAVDFYGQTLGRDWHMLSSPLSDAPLGINYNNDETVYSFGTAPQVYSFSGDGYFPTSVPTGYTNPMGGSYAYPYDYYCWYEPAWQWINFKRNGPSHHHFDPNPETTLNEAIEYHYDNNTGNTASLNVNESQLVKGKGYMMAIDEDTYMQSHGHLNNASVSILLTAQANSYGEHYIGHNLVGNPYHAYLDFTKTGLGSYYVYDADKGGYITYPSGGSKGGDYASQYLHPHQAFFVKKTKTESFTFNPVWVTTRIASTFRGEQPAYPLVNLYAEDAEGRREILVVEFDRPENGGGFKANLRNGNHQLYARYNGEDYGAFFAKKGTQRVTVCFKTDQAAPTPYTLSWNLRNGDFQMMRLIDNITGVDYDMLEHDSYTFEASRYDYATRFYIVFSCTDIEEHEPEEVEVEEGEGNFAFFDGSQWVVNGNGQLDLIDLTGRVLQTMHVSGDQSRVSVNRYSSGLYLLRLSSNQSVKIQKIIVR